MEEKMNGRSLTRRQFIGTVSGTAFAAGFHGTGKTAAASGSSTVYRIGNCPVHDGAMRHAGLDVLLNLLSDNGLRLYRTQEKHRWGAPDGLVAPDDIVLVKVNCQWKFRGATNTDVVRGLVHRILGHPDGFNGEVVIFENGQEQGSFDGDPVAWNRYKDIPECAGVHVNAEDDTLTIDRLVNDVFSGKPVSSYLLDPVCRTFIDNNDHVTDGFRKIDDAKISYPCFTTKGGKRIELREGVWDGSRYRNNLKFINVPVLKTHAGTGITGVLKHCYGVMSMKDDESWSKLRHYDEAGSMCGKMYSLVRMPDLNIVDAIWVTHQGHHRGWPVDTTHRWNILMAGLDPVALDYYGSKNLLLPLGGDRADEHDPDRFPGLIDHLSGAQEFINSHGGVFGVPAVQGDGNIRVVSEKA